MQRGDRLLICIILVMALVGGLYIYTQKQKGLAVEITRDGEFVMNLPLDTPVTIPIHDTDSGAYHLVGITEDGEATMLESNCPDLLCVEHKNISDTTEMIVCLPYRVVVAVVE